MLWWKCFRCAASVSTLGILLTQMLGRDQKPAVPAAGSAISSGGLRVDHLHHQLDDVARRGTGR